MESAKKKDSAQPKAKKSDMCGRDLPKSTIEDLKAEQLKFNLLMHQVATELEKGANVRAECFANLEKIETVEKTNKEFEKILSGLEMKSEKLDLNSLLSDNDFNKWLADLKGVTTKDPEAWAEAMLNSKKFKEALKKEDEKTELKAIEKWAEHLLSKSISNEEAKQQFSDMITYGKNVSLVDAVGNCKRIHPMSCIVSGEKPRQTANNTRPQHYGGKDNPYEVFKVLEAWGLDKCFHLGNVVKYVARAGKKDPTKEIEDLEKAVTYLNMKIEQLKK